MYLGALQKVLSEVWGGNQGHWWAPFGGLAGAIAVFAGLTLVDKIGAGPFNGMIITANICASLAIDHFGLLNMPVHSISLWRIVGAGLMILGIALIAKY